MGDGPWVAIQIDYWRNPKVAQAGFLAASLNLAAIAYCAEQLTDGFVPFHVVTILGAPMHGYVWVGEDGHNPTPADVADSRPHELALSLIVAGLWREAEGGYEVVNYLEHQPSREQVMARREQAREAGRQGGMKRAANRTAKQPAKRGASGSLAESLSEPSSGSQPPVPTPSSSPSTKENEPGQPRRVDVEVLCNRLAERMVDNGCRRPAITEEWRTQARLLLDKDRRSLDAALALIDWCQADDFWRPNIQSLPKFRERYDQLRLQAERRRAPQLSLGVGYSAGVDHGPSRVMTADQWASETPRSSA